MMGFLVAVQFLTRIPTPIRRTLDDQELGPSMRWFPLVGALMGLLVGGLDLLLSVFPLEVRAIVAVATIALISGAIHLDGLMDSCDGLLAFADPARRLEIMHDSRVGSFGIVGAALVLLLKYAAFLVLPADRRLLTFVVACGLSRWAMVYAASRYPPARSDGLAYTFRRWLRFRDLVIATVLAGALTIPWGLSGVVALVAAWVATIVLARYTQAKIAGLTGDVYGAICEIVEVGVATLLPAVWRLTA